MKDREVTQIVSGKREWHTWVLEEHPLKEVISRGLMEAGFVHHGVGVYHLNEEVLVCVSEGFVMVCGCGGAKKQIFGVVYFEERNILWDVIRNIWSSR